MTFVLVMQEKDSSGIYPCYRDLNPYRDVVYHVYQIRYDEYRNKTKDILFTTECLEDARKFLRSCKLVQGIEIKDE